MPMIHTNDLPPIDGNDADLVKDALAEAMASISLGQTKAFILTHLDQDGECRATILGHPVILDRMIQEMVSRIGWDLGQKSEGGIN